MSERAPAHIQSGQVMTVTGPIGVSSMGITLPHEHILNDCRCWWHKPVKPERQYLATERVNMGIIGELRMDPFVNLDNCALDDEQLACQELSEFKNAGGRTVVDPTCRGIGRNPLALARISKATGLNIIMGSGYYLQTSHPPELQHLSIDDVADEIVQEAHVGVGDTGIKIGLIGEIGVSADFTRDEEKSLRGATRAQRRTQLPLMVHLPAWYRHAHRVLDIVGEEGGDISHTILCHMNPSGYDVDYQTSLAERGAFIEYDMIGMDYWYADQQVQCPSDEDSARAITGLVNNGFGDRLLLSQDVFIKMMLSHYGGFGYAYVLKHFVPRLRRHGVSDDMILAMLIKNPASVFHASTRTSAEIKIHVG
jgi:phosphotriesterase-related protein